MRFIIQTKLSFVLALASLLVLAPIAAYAQERIIFQTYRDGNNEIYSMKADGTNPLRLTNNPEFDGEPSVSGNGAKVAFTSTRDGNAEVYVMNPDGTDQKRLTNNLGSDTHPVLNHDGSKIAFMSDRIEGLELYIMNADGTNPTRLTFGQYPAFSPAFSPDGTKILFQRFDGNDVEIFRINAADGSEEVNLTDNTADDRDPSYSPDGTKIVYQVEIITYWDIFVMNADGTSQVNITNRPNVNDVQPTFSPDGNHIAYISAGDIWAMTVGGSGDVPLAEHAASESFPIWSPANHVPTVENPIVNAQVNEGGVATFSGIISDEDSGDSHRVAIDWGEGLTEFYDFPAGTTNFELTHTYVDDAPVGTTSDDYNVLVTILDHRYGISSVTKTVTVNNVNPEITDLTMTPSPTVTVGTAQRLRGNFGDAGYHGSIQDEGLIVTISFGDGQTNVSNVVGPGVIDIFHTYAAIGTYTITVKVTDNDGGVSIQTIPITVTPPAAPSAPANLRVDYIAANRVQLAWTDTSNSEDGYVIERCTNKGCANFTQVGQTGANTSVYVDTNLFANTQYHYRVRAYNLGGSSAYSNVVSAKTLKK